MLAKETVSLEYRKKWLGELKDLLFKYIDKDKYAVFLYGSAVNDLLGANDFDIGILGKDKFPDKLFYKILDDIEESIIPLDVDIVDFTKVKKEFREKALKEIKIWNKPKDILINAME